MHLRSPPFWFFVVLLVSPAARAEEQSLGEVTVHAEEDLKEGTAEAVHDSVAFTTVITSKELKGRRTSLSEVLQEVGGVQTRHLGGLDDFATLSIRGSTSEQVAIYLDGILLNPVVGGGVNLATIPTDSIERIEVYKGAAPARFASTLGGVVNLITKKGGTERQTKLTQSYGSFQTYEGTLLQFDRHGPFSYQVHYTYGRSEGDFSFLDNQGTPFNPNDDRIVTRRNNEFARHNLLTAIDFDTGGGEGFLLRFQNQFFREDRGIPGLATLTSDLADLSTTREGLSFEVTRRRVAGNLNLTLSPFFQYLKQQFSDPEGEIGLGRQDNDNDTYQYGTALEGRLIIGRHQRLLARLEYRGEQFLPEDFTATPSSQPGNVQRSVRNNFGAGLEDEIVLLDERLILNPSLRTEHIFHRGEASALHPVSGKIGIKYTPLSAARWWSVRTNFSRSYRIPNFTELFGDQGSLAGNPDLKAEKGLNWDIGTSLNLKDKGVPLSLEIAYFLNHVGDLIQFLQTSQFTAQPQNLSKARLQGVEMFLAFSPLEFLDLTGNYTFQWAKDISGLPGVSGKFLPGRPLHEASGKVTLHNRWGRLFADLTLLDENFLDTQNLLKVQNRLLLGAGFSVSFLKRFTAGFEAKNLINDRVSDVVGFPLPGRSYYGKLEVKI